MHTRLHHPSIYRLRSLLWFVVAVCTWCFSVPVLADSTNADPTQITEPSHHHEQDNNLSSLDGTSISTKDLGWLGPISVAGLYDNDLGYFTDIKGALDVQNRLAAAVELAGGSRLFRGNGTVGLAFNDHNRFKVSYDRLDEDLYYDFTNGTTRHWDGQNAIGGAYQYVIGKGIFDAVDVGGYYAEAGSKNLGVVNIAGQNFGQRIAGGQTENANADLSYHFWPDSRLKTGIRWDNIRYKTDYVDNNSANGVGVTAGIDQLLTQHIKFSVDTDINRIENTVSGQVGVLVPSPRGSRLELSYVTNYVRGISTDREFFFNGLQAAMSWGYPKTGSSPSYHDDFGPVNEQTLRQWTSDPAVRMSEVLAISDEGLIPHARRRRHIPNLPDIPRPPQKRVGQLDRCPKPDSVKLESIKGRKKGYWQAIDPNTGTLWKTTTAYTYVTEKDKLQFDGVEIQKDRRSHPGSGKPTGYMQCHYISPDEPGSPDLILVNKGIMPTSVMITKNNTQTSKQETAHRANKSGKTNDSQWGNWSSSTNAFASCDTDASAGSDLRKVADCQFYVQRKENYSAYDNVLTRKQYCYANRGEEHGDGLHCDKRFYPFAYNTKKQILKYTWQHKKWLYEHREQIKEAIKNRPKVKRLEQRLKET